jgi:signal transduction histidine kinase
VAVRFVRALKSVHHHNAALQRAVRAREAALEAQFERVRAFERQQLVALERERLMREVHDGLGGHLASTLAMTEAPTFCREDVVQSLRLIAEELALLVDALDPTLDDPYALLAVLRDRMEPRLARGGLRFDWRVVDLPLARPLQPEELHHLMRIVQEAFANIVKHARAQTITVSTRLEAGQFVVEIGDDGVGLRSRPGNGRGLRNMRQRARQLGAQLLVRDQAPGTSVILRLPLDRPGPAADSVVHLDQTEADRFVDGRGAGIHLQLAVEAADVGRHRVHGDPQ